MPSFATSYRNSHPEYREKERSKYREIENNRYKTDETFKEDKKRRAKEYYDKNKEILAEKRRQAKLQLQQD